MTADQQGSWEEVVAGGVSAEWGDYITLTASGAVAISVGGHVIVKPLRDWHALARAADDVTPTQCPDTGGYECPLGDKCKC